MIRIFLSLFFTLISFQSFAQKSLSFDNPDNAYEKGMELYQLEKYGLARIQFAKYVEIKSGEVSTRVAEAAYLERKCAKLLGNNDELSLWNEYVKLYAYSNRIQYAKMHIGDYYKEKKKYRQACRYYQKVDPNGLDEEAQVDYNFNAGYSFFMEEEYDEALVYFNRIKGKTHKHSSSVNYYYSHIQYIKGNYQTALEGFKELEEDKGFKDVVPFYIAQIYYLQEDYANAIKYAKPLLDAGTKFRQADMNRIVADSYYAQKQYEESIPYYEKTIALSKTPSREDYYHLGFAYYFIKEYNKAIVGLSQVTSSEDLMSQNAYYHLGDCYLQIKDKKRARVAFEAASKYEFDSDIQEDALFNYIKLNYELAYSPFNEIINSFTKFIELFPESDKIDQAYDYLGKAFLTTKNYREALASMEKISNKAPGVYRAIQRVAYYRALELFTDKKFSESIEFFDYSLKYAEYDKKLKVGAYYWRGEAYYRLNKYNKCIEDLQTYIYLPGSYKMKEFEIAHYSIAYAHFKQKSYDEAKTWFRKYINLTDGKNQEMYSDASNRIGDCYYVERDFATAVRHFDKASQINGGSADYALFQKAFCIGLQRRYQEKIDELKKLVNKYPESQYVDDALYEMGRAYVSLGQLDKAIFNYKTIKEKYPKGTYAKKAMLQLGLVYYNNNEYDNSLAFYKRVINEFPRTAEADDALMGIRNIYMDQNNLDGYLKYAAENNYQPDQREQDSLTFVAAEKFYMNNDCEHAIKHFESYISTYPYGRFALNAHYYKADCQYRSGDPKGALTSFVYVADQARSFFTEDALLRSGELFYQDKNYKNALEMFRRLNDEADIEANRTEAKIGIMRCLAKNQEYVECIQAADLILASPKIGEEIKREAVYNKANSYRNIGDNDKAFDEFALIAKNTKSAEGAEAKYWIAQIQKERGQVEESEKEIFDYIERGTPHQYWIARSFILLAEIYYERGESFQAIQYLQSIKENYQGDDDIDDRVTTYLEAWQIKDVEEASNDSINNQF